MPGTQQAARGAAKVRKLEAELDVARAALDSVLLTQHQAGVTIAELARATGLSRQAIYKSIARCQRQLPG